METCVTTSKPQAPRLLAHLLANFEHSPDDARARLPVVAALFACSPATVWRRVKAGSLPAPRKDGRITYWLAGELRAKLKEGAK